MAESSLAAALVRAQGKFKAIAKSHENPHFRSKYAPWEDYIEMFRPILAAEGLAFTQPLDTDETGTYLYCVLDHESGEQRKTKFPAPTSLKPQEMISWLTYMKRGTGSSFLGIQAGGEDDDGNAAQAAEPKYRSDGTPAAYTPVKRATPQEMDARPAPSAGPPRPASDAQVNFIADLVKQQGWSDAERDLVFKQLVGMVSDPLTGATAKVLIPELKRIAKKELVVVWGDDGSPQIATAEEHAAAGTESFLFDGSEAER